MKIFLLLLLALSFTGKLTAQNTSDCAAPNALRVEKESASVLWLNWEGNAGSYELSYGTNGEQPTVTRIVSGNRFAVFPYQSDRVYDFRLRSICENGFSAPVMLRHGQPTPCETPISITNMPAGMNEAHIRWNTIGNVNLYTAEYRVKGAPNAMASFQTVNNFVHLRNLMPDTEYEFRLSAFCNNGLKSQTAIYHFTNTGTAMCVIPSGVAVRSLTTESVGVNWNPVPGAVGYEVRWSANGTRTWTNSGRLSGTSFNLTRLETGLTYRIQVRSICSETMSDYVSEWSPIYFGISLLPNRVPSTCNTPEDLRVSIRSRSEALLRWSGNAPGYNVYYSTDAQNYAFYGSTNENRIELSQLHPVRYRFRVQSSCDNGGLSPYSQILTFRMGLWGRSEFSENENLSGLYPNPAKSSVNIVWDGENSISEIRLTDLTGKTVLSRKTDIVSGVNELNLEGVTPGVYGLEIRTENESMFRKLIVE